jgi:hypothetical protein
VLPGKPRHWSRGWSVALRCRVRWRPTRCHEYQRKRQLGEGQRQYGRTASLVSASAVSSFTSPTSGPGFYLIRRGRVLRAV